MQTQATPEAAVESLIRLHDEAGAALRESLNRFFETRKAPTAAERARWRYPELRVTYRPTGPTPRLNRATAKFSAPGV